MSEVTNQLVGKAAKRRLSFSAGAVLTGALASALFFHESSVRAAQWVRRSMTAAFRP